MQQFLILSSWQLVLSILLQSNLNYPDSLGLDDIVQIIENMNISKEQKLIKLSKQHLIMKQNILKSFWKMICELNMQAECLPSQFHLIVCPFRSLITP